MPNMEKLLTQISVRDIKGPSERTNDIEDRPQLR